MRLAVFGATGKTGRHVVERALAAGHDVTAFVRDPARLGISSPKLKTVQGDVTDAAAIDRALEGADAVISVLSSGKGVLTSFAKAVVPAMQRRGIRRIVTLVGAGVQQPGDIPSMGRTLMLGLLSLLAKDVLGDATDHSQLLMRSTLAWTLVRPPRLADGPATGKVRHAQAQAMGPGDTISRADLAAFMVELATSDRYVRQAPMVANAAA